MDLQSPVQFVKGIGPRKAAELATAGVSTVEDLLLHLPMRYEDRTAFARIPARRTPPFIHHAMNRSRSASAAQRAQ